MDPFNLQTRRSSLMVEKQAPGKVNSLARLLKGIGYLTDPKTRPGKVFMLWERSVTRGANWLARNDFYLNRAGGAMERTFLLISYSNKGLESMLKSIRVPTVSDVQDLQADLRRLNDQVEAMSYQFEYLIEKLEREKTAVEQPESDSTSKVE